MSFLNPNKAVQEIVKDREGAWRCTGEK